MSLLEARKLGLEVGDRSLCRELDLKLKPGQCWGILGPNGSGKTTLLHTLAGLLAPACGEVILSGRPISSLGRRAIAQRCGLMLQDSHDPFPASVFETAMGGRYPHLGLWQVEGPTDRQIVARALEQTGLTGLAERQVQTLSGGERRRLAFATLLAQNPPLLLLDEPLNHLDLRHQQQLLQWLTQLCQQGHTVMCVLHDPNQAASCCDHLLLMDGKGGWQAGTAEALLTDETLSHLYDCPIQAREFGDRRWFAYL